MSKFGDLLTSGDLTSD